jgi:ferredoxin
MADLENKYSDNTTGKFYVDDQCTRQEDGGYSFVFKQPESEDEEALCKEAMEGCPVEAIGSDGA